MVYMEVRPGAAHWEKPLEELSEYYNTRAEAEAEAKTIRKYRPEYQIAIYDA